MSALCQSLRPPGNDMVLNLEELLSAESTFPFNFFLTDRDQLRIYSLHSNSSPSVELLVALSEYDMDFTRLGLVATAGLVS